ncbi:hypothetical protein Goshw_004083 [Gossypium schwendimanii]|uniref:DUF4283 domain-containing protein n=1 Tax=Gossypium schwendimanii TaxID=34291 RepID=A0A7J9LKJ9_GOSSC|nr:hypothetical protein [Gossypium schwendimanii]
MVDVEGDFQGQSLKDAEEEEAVKLEAPVSSTGELLENCFTGTFLTYSMINFSSMRAILVNVWHPIGGIMIFDLSNGRFLYRLFHKVDVDSIKVEGPWNFNSHLLILLRLHDGGHGESFCPLLVLQDYQELSFGWDISLKAPFRRATTLSSRWLREGGSGSPSMLNLGQVDEENLTPNAQDQGLIRRSKMDLVIAQDGQSNGLLGGGFDDAIGEDDLTFNGEGLKWPRLHLANSE